MKYIVLTVLLFCITTPSQSQVFENEKYGDLVYPGCIRAKNKKRCMNNKLAQFYLRNLPKDYFEPMEKKEGKIYTYLNLNLLFDSDGNYVDINSQSQGLDALSMANLQLPKMSMPKDVQEFGISSDFKTVL